MNDANGTLISHLLRFIVDRFGEVGFLESVQVEIRKLSYKLGLLVQW